MKVGGNKRDAITAFPFFAVQRKFPLNLNWCIEWLQFILSFKENNNKRKANNNLNCIIDKSNIISIHYTSSFPLKKLKSITTYNFPQFPTFLKEYHWGYCWESASIEVSRDNERINQCSIICGNDAETLSVEHCHTQSPLNVKATSNRCPFFNVNQNSNNQLEGWTLLLMATFIFASEPFLSW